ncbi:Nuclear pore complex protein NUP93A [Camellia lanceoleosa]|uniref:Nuclear pore complex protein NUP93A n=1 Tax=Camellia lanceoleosa TaxID=1840588 RepID=A0ACC0I885_9ERIC|nr:Nuclear pore complex protein NUP93A [Camellia lanceoleosa]
MGANLQELSLNLFESSRRIVHEMAMVSVIQEAHKDNLRSFNDYMMTVLEVSEVRCNTKNYSEELVGCKIKVWWPLDNVF